MPDVSVLSLPVPETIRARLIERNHNFSALKISDVAKFCGYSVFRCHVEVSILHDSSSDSRLVYNIFRHLPPMAGRSIIENAVDNSKPYAIKPSAMDLNNTLSG
jgi:hypothetical protein